jgi:hypothetical protein
MSLDELNVRVRRIAIRPVIVTNVRHCMSCSGGDLKISDYSSSVVSLRCTDWLLLLMDFLPQCGEVSLLTIDWMRRSSLPGSI